MWFSLGFKKLLSVFGVQRTSGRRSFSPFKKSLVDKPTVTMMRFAALVAGVLLAGETQAFYLPGVNPQSFAEGDP
jgi:hypothetical protein